MEKLKNDLRKFAEERHWQEYHSPKNLAMALSVEVSELAEIFQWMTPKQSRQVEEECKKHICEEVGDIMIYLTMLADKFGLDPLSCAKMKMVKNAEKYPVPNK